VAAHNRSQNRASKAPVPPYRESGLDPWAYVKAVIARHPGGQSGVAPKLGVHPSQLNRWANGRVIPDEILEVLEDVLGRDDIKSAFATLKYDLYVSSPITSFSPLDMASHREGVGQVVESIEDIGLRPFWPAGLINSRADLLPPRLATKRNLEILHGAKGLLYIQLLETTTPSNTLVELGMALGRRMRTTIIIGQGIQMPSMFAALEVLGARMPHVLPKVRVIQVSGVDEAVNYVRTSGRSLFGLG